MIITQIRFENYRAYYGEVIFDFPIDGERNVSIIFANNDVGKTCFFSGVLFCLYGSKDSDSLKDLINVNAAHISLRSLFLQIKMAKKYLLPVTFLCAEISKRIYQARIFEAGLSLPKVAFQFLQLMMLKKWTISTPLYMKMPPSISSLMVKKSMIIA